MDSGKPVGRGFISNLPIALLIASESSGEGFPPFLEAFRNCFFFAGLSLPSDVNGLP